MSLQIWLPLNGDLHNQGLSNVTVTNHGATVDNNGKIGKCYSFNGSNNYIEIDGLNLGNSWSYGCWFKEAASSRSWCGIIILNNNGGDTDMQLGFYSCPTNSWLQTTANGQYNARIVHTFDNQWHHLFATFNGSTLKTYMDGILINSKAITADLLSRTKLTLGARCRGSSYDSYWLGQLNDFRLYDHCLSPKEVEEISKGLVLHYKLDQNLNILDNCYNYPTFQTASTNGGWSHWGASGHAGTYGQNADKQYIFRNNQSYSHWVANGDTATATYLIYQSPAFSGGFRSLQAIIKEENSRQITEEICVPAWNARNGGAPANKWTSIDYLGDGFYLCKCEGISQDGSNNLIGMHIKPSYKIYISEMYCENDREICSDIFNQNNLTTIYDSSGYNNNGIITGSLQVDTNSSRYNYCTYMADGKTSYITTPILNLPGDQITMNFWFKSSNKSPTGGYHMPLESTSSGQYEISIYQTGYLRGGLYVGGSRKVDNCTSTKLTDGNWHMCTLTYDGATIKRYVDAISEKDTSATGTLNTTQSFVIGHYGSNTSYASKETYESDIRIYTTALTPAQIEELYHTSASIDNNGNIYAREIIES